MREYPSWVSPHLFSTIALIGFGRKVSVFNGFLGSKCNNSTKFIFYRS